MKWQVLGDKLPKGGNFLTRRVGRAIFGVMGWRIEGEFPNRDKAIVALVPHSSNFDFFLTIAFIWATGMRASFLIKHTVFWYPLGNIIRALGGIPVDRTQQNGLIRDVTQQFREKSKWVLGITPSGTRKPVKEWKDGIARIAAAAQVPIVPAVMNYRTRTVHFAPLIEGVTEVRQIMERIRDEASKGIPRFSYQ
ncbi:MAG: 1-acyl-sn-glycerol-3-phosphate acyltransferase [Luminiphilus sp.]|nr:1-acyl-sn-glycerol-3-phosphate acyltransferase [Luminiphilus sp.]